MGRWPRSGRRGSGRRGSGRRGSGRGGRGPSRTCVACRQEAGKADLVRVVRLPGGSIELDLTGHKSGRGAYIHPAAGCIETARKRRAMDRSLGAAVPPEVWLQVSNLA